MLIFSFHFLQLLIKKKLAVFSLITVALINLYLMTCAFSGFLCLCFKFNFGLTFHLQKKDTYLHSFLLNICLFFLIASGTMKFSAKIFRRFSKYTYAHLFLDKILDNFYVIGILSSQNVFLYFMLVMMVLTALCFALPQKNDTVIYSIPPRYRYITKEVGLEKTDLASYDMDTVEDGKLFK